MPENIESNVFVGKSRVRGRDIRAALNGRNLDPVLIQTLEALADNDKTQRDQIGALADLVNGFVAVVEQNNAILERIMGAIPDIKKLLGVSNVLSQNAQGVLKNIAQDAIRLKDPEET